MTRLTPADGKRPAVARHVALVGTFAPRKCGIATFTTDIFEKLAEFEPGIRVDVYVLNDPAQPANYRDGVKLIDYDDPASYARAAEAINDSGADAVWLQHEYGIYGGDDGILVTDFVDRLAPPLILTPHTVLSDPSDRQAAILRHLVERASRMMVMSRHSRDLLATRYAAPNELIEIVEHGAPDRPFGRQQEFKRRLGIEGRDVLMTFGLLGPGKGVEHVIEALPSIVRRHPSVLYRIVGATHPNLIAQHGEEYREQLKQRVADLDLADHVEWVNRFCETEELLDQLEACDIYITPYPNMQQSTSGTLSYAVALGKAVVSTPYLHASELLEGGVGLLIEPNSSEAIAEAVDGLLDDRDALQTLQENAYAKGRGTIWPCFARAAAKLIDDAAAGPARPVSQVRAPSLDAVLQMSDATGMMQHAVGVVPDRSHGYCQDDNVRALMLMNLASNVSEAERRKWTRIYASFVQDSWNPDAGRFRNFMRFDRTYCEELGSDDSNGRTFWALGQTLEMAAEADMRVWATRWYDETLLHLSELDSPRAMAFLALGAAARLRVEPEHGASRKLLEKVATRLAYLLEVARRPDWVWFEAVLGYDNPRLSQALIESGQLLERAEFTKTGLESLEWIAERQTTASGHFRPIGSESFGHEHQSLPFDQQPLEAQAAIDASLTAWRATGQTVWKKHGRTAWQWFFGANDRGAVLADMATGRCRDGVNPRGVNLNCGAESILAFQLAYHSMLALDLETGDESEGALVGHQQQAGIAFALT
ncbi:glycosyltransferase family 4 protein [Qipengyuania atrilutea]|uniref:glycosyltransferase family 4 protein n=1 Tax=Qipengyuania atrilutea TaxID=2744473 RepID=UPI00298DF720|nr:glycosyltransferase family 4 protein [Actirhodobacter atriluteus]